MSSFVINDELFLKATKPSRYSGGEFNSSKKAWDTDKLTIALAFPEPYELGMSHLGYQILYGLLNRDDRIVCERVFLPWQDMQAVMKDGNLPLFSIESRKQIKEFDVLGFSLQYEMSYTNVLKMLDLAGIPLLAGERGKDYPIVLGGGPCATNPEPLAPFFDAFFIGEAEEGIFEFTEAFLEWKTKNLSREHLLEKMASIEGIYAPSLKSARTRIKRRVLKSLDINLLPKNPIVPFMQVTHDRVSVEIQRGCTKGCRFCQAGMIYRPTRQRNASDIIRYAVQTQKNTGFEDISFLSLNSADHPNLCGIFSDLSARYRGSSVSFSLPSTRIDKFDKSVMQDMLSLRKTGYTFAPEAGSERLRKAINKSITDDEILLNLETIFKAGWNLVKLYFMVGLPTETGEDIEAIISLTRKISKMARGISPRNRINLNLSPFVPKPHTPYQWLAQEPVLRLEDKINRIKSAVSERAVNIRWHEPFLSALEATFARGDSNLARLLKLCHQKGAQLDSWADMFKKDIWVEAMAECGVSFEKTAGKAINTESYLPWDFIDTGITREYLLGELKKTYSGEATGDCAFSDCNQCGLCSDDLKPITDNEKPAGIPLGEGHKSQKAFSPLILHFKKTGRARLVSHLELIKVFERALRRSSLNVKISQGYHPIPILKFSRAIPIGMESEDERLSVYPESSMNENEIKNSLNENLPQGFSVTSVEFLQEFRVKKELNPSFSKYVVSLDEDACRTKGYVDEFLKKKTFIITKATKKALREIDLKDIIFELKHENGLVRMTVREDGDLVNLFDAVSKIFGGCPKENIKIKKVGSIDYGNRTDNKRDQQGDEDSKARKRRAYRHPG